MNTITVHVGISGRVQGVGFRDSLRLVATALDVTGWVQNCADGSVEARLQGEETAVERVIAWCHNGPPGANVRHVRADLVESAVSYIAFSRRQNA